MDIYEAVAQRLRAHSLAADCPVVTLTYAQTLDGCIALRRDRQLELSGNEARHMTHYLRASHDAILVGIGTVLADDPRLSVRLVDGNDPQPIILDTNLRIPLNARLLQNPGTHPWVISGAATDPEIEARVHAAGAEIIHVPLASNRLVNLALMLRDIYERGVKTLMVEGGARILTNFLVEELADWVVLTIAPVYARGLNAIDGDLLPQTGILARLSNVESQQMGEDIVLWGDLRATTP